MSSLRLQRVRELLKRELGEIIRREIPVGPAGLITVNDVTVSSDLHAASVYIGILGNDGAEEKGVAGIGTITASTSRASWARPSSSNTHRTCAS